MRVIIAAVAASLVPSISAFAGGKPIPITNVPTLSEWGVISLVGALGVIGAIALRKRLASR